jgi:hypothetical protein
MQWRILGQECPNITHKYDPVYSRIGTAFLLPFLQGHRPEQQKQAGHKKDDGRWRHLGLRAGAKEFVNHVNKNQQSSELDKLRTSYLMTL